MNSSPQTDAPIPANDYTTAAQGGAAFGSDDERCMGCLFREESPRLAAGGRSTFEVDGVHFKLFGGSDEQRLSVEGETGAVLRTGQGSKVLASLKTRGLDGSGDGHFFEIGLMDRGRTGSDLNQNRISLNIRRYEIIQTTQGPQGASIIRRLAHEFGHAALGIDDVYSPMGGVKMLNVDLVENIIMQELRPTHHEYYNRTQYEPLGFGTSP